MDKDRIRQGLFPSVLRHCWLDDTINSQRFSPKIRNKIERQLAEPGSTGKKTARLRLTFTDHCRNDNYNILLAMKPN